MTFRTFTSPVLGEFAVGIRQLKQWLMADLTALSRVAAGKVERCGSLKTGRHYVR